WPVAGPRQTKAPPTTAATRPRRASGPSAGSRTARGNPCGRRPGLPRGASSAAAGAGPRRWPPAARPRARPQRGRRPSGPTSMGSPARRWTRWTRASGRRWRSCAGASTRCRRR
ncbi:unnamed protein product, partial [Prorocentrum cordatum]